MATSKSLLERSKAVSNQILSRLFMRLSVVLALVIAALHAGVWLLLQDKREAADLYGRLNSMSYTAFEGAKRESGAGFVPTPDIIRSDLKVLAPLTKVVRTYSSTEGLDLIPGIAAEFDLKVTVGAWLDDDAERNKRELARVISLAKIHSNVNGIYVGNELNVRGNVPLLPNEKLSAAEQAIMKGDDKAAKQRVTIDHLIQRINEVRKATNGAVPLSTGEIYTVWLENPKLVEAVDYIAIHVLPYWEGTKADRAVASTIEIYNKVKAAYPHKKVKISEFGWPSAGFNRDAAVPGRMEQAQVLRDFAARADDLNIDYNIIEAYDQPWKTFEGGVGPYWGAINAAREMKFAWTGPLTDHHQQMMGLVAVGIGFLLSLLLLVRQGQTPARLTLAQGITLGVAANAVGAWIAMVYGYWVGHYFVTGEIIAYGLGLVMLVPLIVVALGHVGEIAQFLFGRSPRRLLAGGRLAQAARLPKVSIHIPACREPAEMLKETLDSIAALNYPDFECVVLINNTPDEAMCLPVEEHCRKLGSRFKYVNAGMIKGFKAYGLNIALEHTAPEAEIIGVLDADYKVDPDWLKDLVPAFADARVGLVQAPQDHRDGDRSPLHAAMNAEYAGFFDIGMVLRNESNAIITHGTMCLVRRKALDSVGGWSDETICEDTDLGLTILEQGWLQHYTNRRYGHGLLPNSFNDYKKQRYRWASGGMQIVHKHIANFLPGRSKMSLQQRKVFATGWMSWMANEALGVMIALLNILWTPVVAFLNIAVPGKILTLPILFMLGISLAHFVLLYKKCVTMTPKEMLLALVAHMSLQWTIARAVGSSLKFRKLVFVRTDKGGKAKGAIFPARDEAIIGGLLLASALTVYLTNYTNIVELNLFAAVMVVQSLPFLSSLGLALMERMPRKVPATQPETVPAPAAAAPVAPALRSASVTPMRGATIVASVAAPASAQAVINLNDDDPEPIRKSG